MKFPPRCFGLFWCVLPTLLVSIAIAAEKSAPPLGLPSVPVPSDNPMTTEKIALGKQLYFDGRLSADNKVSCASCHDPAKGFSNGDRFATGVEGKKGGRSAPTVINTAYGTLQFWDGRVKTLEDQALGPIQNPIEMNMTLDAVVKKLNGIDGYKTQFKKVFGTDVTSDGIAKAIAAYERTVISGNAPYDKFKAGDTKALSESAQRGMKLFFGKAHCSACHAGPNFSDNSFHNVGVGMGKKDFDKGRADISKLSGDTGAFKTPTLREIAKSGPYFHDGKREDTGRGRRALCQRRHPQRVARRRNLQHQDRSDGEGRLGEVHDRRTQQPQLPGAQGSGVAEIET